MSKDIQKPKISENQEHQNTKKLDGYAQVVIDTFSKWSNQVSVQEGIVFLLIKGEHQPITLVAMGDEASKMVTIFARFPEFCPSSLKEVLAQKLNSINFNVHIGCWSVDEEDGEIRYRITQYFPQVPTVRDLQTLTSYIVSGMDMVTVDLLEFLSLSQDKSSVFEGFWRISFNMKWKMVILYFED